MNAAKHEDNGSAAVAAPFVAGHTPTLAEIQSGLDALAVAMVAKALREPSARFSIPSHGESYIALTWKVKQDAWADGHKYFNGDAAKVLAEAATFVAALPSPEQARLEAFRDALGAAIERGKEADIDVEYVNPLLALMKKLSKNALEHRVSA